MSKLLIFDISRALENIQLANHQLVTIIEKGEYYPRELNQPFVASAV